MVFLKLIIIIAVFLQQRLVFADNACHVGSPACENVTPDFNKTFGECCNNYNPLQRQDSFGSGPGSETCIRCASLGCHVDKNCASETGDEVYSVEECCSRRNRRSFRDPSTGTCHLCAFCFMDDECDGPGTYTDNIRQCGGMRGSKSFKDPMTHECQPCSLCFLEDGCDGEGTFAANLSECCSFTGARSYKNPITKTCERCPMQDVYGDPHFIVPLPSKELLCYSIQGYPGLAFNLIYNKNFIINAQFVDSVGDTSEATWIGKLAVIPHSANHSDIVLFDSVDQEVTIVGKGTFKASIIRKIIINEDGSIKFTQGIEKQTGNPTVHVSYTNPQADFDVNFHSNHLNVDWNLQYDEFADLYGLMGQFMKKGVDIDTQKEMLIHSDGRDPVPVTRDSLMTGDANRQCWKVMNYGHQGEGFIKGKIFDYVVPEILSSDLNL